ncbi:septum formation protein Maf [Candidatus Peregrinibacteria bacterium]|nr:septum formation protein Maf [Candidatus Peregrinibacteria bacterium]
MLKKHGIKCRIHVSKFKEILKHSSPRHLVLHNAEGKALDVARHYENKNAIIIGVDTVGVLDGKILGKPLDRAHAKRMIKMLSGTTHKVISGLCVVDVKSRRKICSAETTKVTFRKVSDAELEKYLDSNHWKGKAGSYAIQGRAKGFVERIDGDITNVIGIPTEKVKKMLTKVKRSKLK